MLCQTEKELMDLSGAPGAWRDRLCLCVCARAVQEPWEAGSSPSLGLWTQAASV